MKFRVSRKDFGLFCLYCVILLYFCAIAVLNLSSFAKTGKFYGLLPFEAFAPKYIGATFGLFIAVLVLIFTSVSSYIFDRDKNSGFSFGIFFGEKKSDGYEKWATDKDIKAEKDVEKVVAINEEAEAAGVPLINKGKELWVDNGEYHTLVIGSSGSGKTETIVKPMVNLLAKKGESMVITDPKGELYEFCGEFLKKKGYKIVVLNFRDPLRGNSWNPLTLPYLYYRDGNTDKGIELLDDVALNILYNKDNKGDDFWEKSAADYFSGLALGLFQDAQEKEVNLNSINYMSSVGEDRYGTGTFIKQYFNAKGEQDPAYMFANNTINAPGDTKGSILSTFRQKIRQFTTKESLSEMLSYSDFDMRQIGNEKTAVFMIIHDEKKTYHGLMTIFIKQCYETLIDVAFQNGGKLKYRTNFILDEFANMPPLKDVDAMVTAARSRKIRFTFIIQNFAQLNEVYGDNDAQTIRGNCGNTIYLISTEMKALEEISKMCGEVKSKDKDKTASTPLITVTDLQKMKLFDALIKRVRMSPFKTSLTPNFKMDWGYSASHCELPKREQRSVDLFDVKSYVTEKSKNDQLQGDGRNGGNPFTSGGFNPFGSTPIGSNGNPFGGGGMSNPFAPSNSNPFASAGGNPFSPKAPMPNNYEEIDDVEKPNSTFASISNSDIDQMVKDIEKKIAEIEEEEAKEAEEKEKSAEVNDLSVKTEYDNSESKEDTIDNLDMTQEINLNNPETTKINVDSSSEVLNDNIVPNKEPDNNGVTDDEFYDDFFE